MKRLSLSSVSVSIAMATAIVFCGCQPPEANHYYPDVEMSPAEKSDLQAALARLDRAVAKAVPSISSQLLPGADDQQIAELRSALGGSINEPIETWFRWHNGTSSRVLSLLPLGSPLSIQGALTDRKQIQKIPLVPTTRSHSLKILDDLAGDGFFIDLRSETPYVFYEMLEDPEPGYFGTLTEFVNFIADCYEAGVFTSDESGILDYEEDRYYEFESRFLDKASSPE